MEKGRGSVADEGILNLTPNATVRPPEPSCFILHLILLPSVGFVGFAKVKFSVAATSKIAPADASVSTMEETIEAAMTFVGDPAMPCIPCRP